MSIDLHPYYPVPDDDLTILDLLQIKDETLDQEINLLRGYIRRVTLRQSEAATLLESACLLRAVSLATFSLTQLIRANQTIKEARQPILTFKEELKQIGRQKAALQKSGRLESPAETAPSPEPPAFTPEPYVPRPSCAPTIPKFCHDPDNLD